MEASEQHKAMSNYEEVIKRLKGVPPVGGGQHRAASFNNKRGE